MRDRYESPLGGRYASDEMQYLFSAQKRAETWRELWTALAEAEMELGLPVAQEQVDELRVHQSDIDFDAVRQREEEVRHDVMAHVYVYGQAAPKAAGIIHLGATSCFVTDNGDLIIMREALRLLQGKLLEVLRRLRAFALEYRNTPCLGYTHFQPAQLVTVGKRATLWMQDLTLDLDDLDHLLSSLKLLGNKGTTGTQASFLDLFDGDEEKVRELERRFVRKMGFSAAYPVSGQTYSRKVDSSILAVLSGIAQSASKFATDLRLLMHEGEVEEPIGKSQIGSSAMAYKRNPMRSERMCALSRHVLALYQDTAMTASTQWLERTLDDSANRRIALSEAFLSTDAILELYADIAQGMVVYPEMARRHVEENLPFMATENILMEAVKKGGDRQEVHERIRVHSHAAARAMKLMGEPCDLLIRIAADPAFGLTLDELNGMLRAEEFTGRSGSQVEEFIKAVVDPLLAQAPQEVQMGGVRV